MAGTQMGLAFFGVLAVYLAQSKDPQKRKWASIVGMAGQPFWFIEATGPGMLLVVTLYTLVWAQGIWNHWIKDWLAHKA